MSFAAWLSVLKRLRALKRLRVLRLEPEPPMGTGLLAGRGGWLFWIAHRRRNLDHWRDVPRIRKRLRGWRALVRARHARLAASGIAYRLAIIPDKLSIHHGKLVNPEIDPAMAIGRRLQERLAADGLGEAVVIDLFDELAEAAATRDLYMRTDTHFTPAGYLLAYAAICRRLGAPAAPHVLDAPTAPVLRDTDLGSKLVPPEPEWCDGHLFDRRAVRVSENGLTRFRETYGERPESHVGSVIVTRNDDPAADPRRLLVFGDSFTFAPEGLGAMLAESFREVHLVWSTRLDGGYIAAAKPDIVLTELSEFFLGPVPSDDGFSVELFAAERLARLERGETLPPLAH